MEEIDKVGESHKPSLPVAAPIGQAHPDSLGQRVDKEDREHDKCRQCHEAVQTDFSCFHLLFSHDLPLASSHITFSVRKSVVPTGLGKLYFHMALIKRKGAPAQSRCAQSSSLFSILSVHPGLVISLRELGWRIASGQKFLNQASRIVTGKAGGLLICEADLNCVAV